MTIRLIPNDDEPERDIEGLDTGDPADDRANEAEAIDHETAELRLMLSMIVSGHSTRAVLAALTLTLQSVAAKVCRDRAGVEKFAVFFQDGLRERWLVEQQTEQEH